MNPNDNDQKMLDRDLRDFPVPPPPAGLLEKIQAEIPDATTLAGKAPETTTSPRRWPLRLAATLALAALGGTVAWQVMKTRQGKEFDRQAAEFQAPRDPYVAPHAFPSPPLPPPAAATAAPEPTDTAPTSTSLTESFSAQGKQAPQVAQPVEVAEAILNKKSDRRAEGALDGISTGGSGGGSAVSAADGTSVVGEVEAGVEGGVPGGVTGGVAGGVVGGVPGGVVSGNPAPAAPAPAKSMADWMAEVKDEKHGYSIGYDALQRENPPTRGDEDRGRDKSSVPDTMIFRETPANRFVDTAEDRLSTFALDVDTGSYTLARGYLERGLLPPPEAIRVEEFVNAQRYDDPAPSTRNRGGGDFALVAEGAPAPFYPGGSTRLLRFSVKAREIDPADRKSAVLTFVVDISGSMNQENRLGLVKRALGLLLDELRPDDRVGLVVFGTTGRIVLHHTRDLAEIRRAIAELEPEGSTNTEEGLRLAYDLADEGWRQGASNRIILCSDGVANVGATGPEAILGRIGGEAQRGIALTTVGFGMGNYNDALMEQLADQGDGTYHYVDQLDAARKVFVDNLTGTLETVAKEAKAQVDFDPESVVRWRLLGYENRDIADRDFRNDRIDAGELGSGHQATALYEVRLRPGVAGGDHIATLRLRWQSVAAKEVVEAARELDARDLDRDWAGASTNLRHAAVAAAFAEKLKAVRSAEDLSWSALRREAEKLESANRRNDSVRDLADAIARAVRIVGVRDDRRRDDDDDARPAPNRRLEEE